MTDEELKKFFDEGLQYYKHSLFNKAIEIWDKINKGDHLYFEALYNIGIAYKDLNEEQTAIEYLQKIPEEDKLYIKAQINIGRILSDSSKFDTAYHHLTMLFEGNKLYINAKYSKDFTNSDFEGYNMVIKHLEKITKEDSIYHTTQYIIGLAYILLKNVKEAFDAIQKSEKDIFGILPLFNFVEEDATTINIIKGIFSEKLDSDDFFKTTIKEDKKNNIKYKEIFIKSLYIISLLQVNSEQEKQVAHYTRKWVVEQMLFTKSKLRLKSVIGANDPKEGITLLDFLNIKHKAKAPTTYQAFITCFTFNPESLNQFRLYGKEDNKEATGVSLIVNKNFFNSSVHLNSPYPESILSSPPPIEDEANTREQKYSLYRCIYIDPQTKQVISIGHKEEYTFYREQPIRGENAKKRISEIREYQEYIKRTFRKVKNEVNKLNSYIKTHKKDLDESIISELLLPLRHLTKHAAFKEEQECRIFDIENLKTSNIISPKRDSETCTFNTMHIDYDLDLSDYVEKVIFAPMTPDLEQFHAFSKYKGYNFPCERCDHPFSMKTT